MNTAEKVIKKTPILSDYAHKDADSLIAGSLENKEKEPARFFKIWYVEPRFDLSNYNQERLLNKYLAEFGEDALEKNPQGFIEWRNQKQDEFLKQGTEYLELRKTMNVVEEERIEEVQEDSDKRAFMINKMTPSDISGEINLAFEIGKAKNPPEIIILRDEQSEFSETRLGSGIVGLMRQKIKTSLEKHDLLDKESLLQPIIVVSVADKKLKTAFLEQGANLVVDDFNPQEINDLAQLVAKIKSEPASLYPELVKEEKNKFYKHVAGLEMGDRSQITADTEKEVEILQNIFAEYNVRNILDVGCGNGRIDEKLIEDNNLRVLAMDSNEGLLRVAEEKLKRKNISFAKGDLLDYTHNEKIEHQSQDAVIYTWHAILEAFGVGNLLKTLNSAWLALREKGVLVFDMPTRENFDMTDGWYQNQVTEKIEYLSYIPTEEEIKFILRLTGFDTSTIKINRWQTKPSKLYKEGMKKITVSVLKK